MTEDPKSHPWFALPATIRQLFSNFPLRQYEANSLPQRSPPPTNNIIFYSFQRDNGPSYNPSCLKYQTLLKIHGTPHEVRPSNNHASPFQSLPFLVTEKGIVAASKIPKSVGRDDIIHPKEDAYTALVDHDLRNAWLYNMYLDEGNFQRVAFPLYCESASSNIFVQQSLRRQLQVAARDELLKTFDRIDPSEIYDRAQDAFSALATLLGKNENFFDAVKPGLFDASVFAYTHLLLDLDWHTTTLTDSLREHQNLVNHRERLSQYV